MITKKLGKKNIMIVGAALLVLFVMSIMTVSADPIRENDDPVITDDSGNGEKGLSDEEPLVIAPNPEDEPLIISPGPENQPEDISTQNTGSFVTADMAFFGGILVITGVIGSVAILKRKK